MAELNDILQDADALMGIGYADIKQTDELLGAISRLAPAKRMEAMKKIVSKGIPAQGSGQQTSRDKAVNRIGSLPEHIKKGIASKALQLSDALYYVVKPAGGAASVRMFEASDVKTPGITNVNGGKLEKDAWFLLTHIGLLSGVNAIPAQTAFAPIATFIRNGDMEFKANSKYLLPKDVSCNVFDTTGRTDVDQGFLLLDSPKWIEPQIDISCEIRFAAALAANTNIKLVLKGQSVMPY